MADILGTSLVILIIGGAIVYALVKGYQWLKKETGGKFKMSIFEQEKNLPKWEEYKGVALGRGAMSLPEIQAKIEDGWELISVVNMDKPYYYFRKVR